MIEMASWKAKAEIIRYKLNHNLYSLKFPSVDQRYWRKYAPSVSPGDGLSGGEIWHGVF